MWRLFKGKSKLVLHKMRLEQKIKPIPELKISGKEQKKFEFSWSFKSLKDWFIGITLRF